VPWFAGGTADGGHTEKVFDYMEMEDSPRSLPFQLDLLRHVGFLEYDVLHRNGVNACFFAAKSWSTF
jgi:tRNA (cmo5U34)-methyltransferase